MNDDSHIISGFDSSAGGNDAPFAVDFGAATLLDRNGSTCDAYVCSIQRRRVFVKRLKAEYRDNPLYRAAFSKEYDLGVSLSHPSLPRYVGFGGDYIVMDFVEGDTLADLIRRGDRRFRNKNFVRKLLLELIDVVEYLHYRNVVHCDIKADNIIVSPYPDRPVSLIDLDKAYSPWLDSTHGNTGNYGCDGCADGAIDFKGIGLIAEKLGVKRLAKACGDNQVSTDSLRKSLGTKRLPWIIVGLAVGAVVAIGVASSISRPEAEAEPNEITEAVDAKPDTTATATVVDTPPVTATEPETPPVITSTAAMNEIDDAWITALIAEKSAEIKGYRQKLLDILDCDTIPPSLQADAFYDYTYSSGLAQTQIISIAVTHYLNKSELEVQTAVRANPGWSRLEKEKFEMLDRYMEWQAKVSRRPSARPASPPDTTPDAAPNAPRR